MQPDNSYGSQNYPNLDDINSKPQMVNPYQTTDQQYQQQAFNNNNNNQSIVFNPFIPQINIKNHVIRNHKTWHELIQQTSKWVNTKIHVLRVISISVVYCHTTGSGQCTVFYNDSEQPNFKQLILNNVNRTLGAAHFQTTKAWDSHHDKLKQALPTLASTGGIIGISELEVDHSHNRALSIIWYRR